jgi:hypothetical protein
MVSYPLAFPSVSVRAARFQLTRSVGKTVSPFTFAEQVILNQGERWEGEVSFVPVRQEDAGLIKSFLANLRGSYGTFLYGDPDYLAQGPLGDASGSPLVDGASQTGQTLDVKSAPINTTGWLKAGDYFQLGTGASARLYMLTADADTDGSGNVTLEFWPNLRTSPSDSQAIIVTGAKGAFRASGNAAAWDISESNIYGFRFPFEEAITE